MRKLVGLDGTPNKAFDTLVMGRRQTRRRAAGEIDEILKSYPVVAGAGIPMVADGFSPTGCTPTQRETFDNGAQVTWLTRS
ncbi:hypothetical protein [Actinophytocola algeriensis]|uniref:Uncharacterized protein n=1 Tax=Actinophytocola algeriensis TaxID=1768010 RepID=A0A7W7Q9Y7_9PSEU|nr:hypothetical protein [Actinophytocola algeriensis]MBB4909608.1 hypothetical protein [Actinophytocola algeriensis]MBE1475598.1 hypothetical protein [Actinophytocola algeriensis]